MRILALILPSVMTLGACSAPEETDTEQPGDTGDTGEEADPTDCELLGLPSVPLDTEGPSGVHRRTLADDFEIPLVDGTTWRMSDHWTGCDVHVVVSSKVTTFDGSEYWQVGLEELLEKSPRNARYLFVPVRATSSSGAKEMAEGMAERIDQHLATLSDEDREWWEGRLLVVPKSSMGLDGNFGDVTGSTIATYGMAIDRFQRWRGVGSGAHIEEYDSAQGWFDARLDTLAWEVEYLNFEAERQARLDAIEATIVEPLGGDVIEQYEDFEVELPAGIEDYDTLEVDVIMECPDPDKAEPSNCGAWDYLAHLWLFEGEGEDQTKQEVARFITTYHRESRWVVDASHALPWLADGGTRTMRYEWAPSWNVQPTGVTLRLRFSDQGKDAAPAQVIPLWTGGAFNADYNPGHPPVDVEIPADAEKVELVVITTGHGMEDGNCAEFCDHSHEFTVGGATYLQEFPAVGDDAGCADTSGSGTVPNQWGTWWYGRGGWCPGRRVDPWVVDITGDVTPGSTETLVYRALYSGAEITNDANRGSIELRSWVVVSR